MDEENQKKNVRGYFRDVLGCSESEVTELSNRFYKWTNGTAYEENLREILHLPKSETGGKKKLGIVVKSPFHEIETELYGKFLDWRKNSRKVSSHWLRVQGMKIFEEEKEKNPERWGKVDYLGLPLGG